MTTPHTTPEPENIRLGAPYDDPKFEALCREHDIWGTAQAALCAVFWRSATQTAKAAPEGVGETKQHCPLSPMQLAGAHRLLRNPDDELAGKMFTGAVSSPVRYPADAQSPTGAAEGAGSRDAQAQEAEIERLRAVILQGAHIAESLKRECGTNPESPIAIQNGRYMVLSTFLRSALAADPYGVARAPIATKEPK